MHILIYSIGKSTIEPDVLGIDKKPIRCLEISSLCAYYSKFVEKEQLQQKPNQDHHPALIFQKTIARIHQMGASLPMQYGMVVSSAEELQAIIEANSTDIKKELNRIGHTYEYSCHFSRKHESRSQAPAGLTQSDSPGAKYLLKKYEQSRIATQVAVDMDRLAKKVEEYTSEHLIEVKKSNGGESLSLHLRLVVNDLDKKSLITKLTKDFPQFQIHIFGPYPPSHFVKVSLKNPKQ
ncbi:MAG: GvpL/GvpF family gas vesicle protein [Bacteroidota bacterium]